MSTEIEKENIFLKSSRYNKEGCQYKLRILLYILFSLITDANGHKQSSRVYLQS